MEQFSPALASRLLEKFNLLKCYYEGSQAMITKTSMQENFHRLFTQSNDYLAERLYVVLTGPEHVDLFKPQFLRVIHTMLYGRRLEKMKILFGLFNVAEDGKLKANEISNMLYSFPPESKSYQECMDLADLLLNRHLGNSTVRIDYISFQYFNCVVQ